MKKILFCFPPLSFLSENYYFRTQQMIDSLKKDFQIEFLKPLSSTGRARDRRFTLKKVILFCFKIPCYLTSLRQADFLVIYPTLLWYFWLPAGKLFRKKIILDHFTTRLFPTEFTNAPAFTQKILSLVDKFVYCRIDLVVTHSQTMKREIINFYQTHKNKVLVIPSLVDLKLFNPQKYSFSKIKRLKKKYSLPLDKKILLYHGRFHLFHGLDILNKTARLSLKKGRNYAFVFLGGKRKNKNNTYFIAPIEFKKLPEVLALTDLWLGRFSPKKQASRALSSCLLQAMAMSRPVITYASPESKSLIEQGIDGFLVKNLTPESVLAQIDKIINDQSLLIKVGQAARQKIKNQFPLKKWQIVNQRIKRLLN